MDGETGYSTIHWIRAEVDATLNQARQALEAYVEHPEDNSHLRQCASCLKQVRGTLQIAELMGGAGLAQEMERLADLIAVDEQRRQPEVFDLLMRTMLVLTNYLEWILSGYEDLPLALIWPINEIRSMRGVEPLAELALFAPDLSRIPTDMARSNCDEISSLARRIRPLYESALVEWLRQREGRTSLMRMARAIKQLEQSSTLPTTARIWWIVGGIIEALLDQGLEPTLSLKQALGHVDGLIKILGESGDEGLARVLSDEFTKGLLYHVAKARSRGLTVMEIKEAFQLDLILPPEHLLEEIRLSLSAPTAQLWESVAPALLEDLTRVKDTLDVFARQGGWSLEGLQPIEHTLRRLSDTLEMLGLNRIRQLILEQLGRLQAMAGRDQSRVAPDLASLAKDLLYAELLIKRAVETDYRSSLEGERVTEEDPELLTAVIRTAKVDMLRIIEAIDAFIRSPEHGGLQQSVPVLFKRIVGALSMLSFRRAASLFEACDRYITQELLEKRVLPDPAILDTLADVLAGLEQYLRVLEEHRGDRQGLLDKVQQSLASLAHGCIEAAPPPQIPVIGQDPMIDPLALTTRIDCLIADERAAPAADTAQEPLFEAFEAAVSLGQCEQSLSHDSQLLASPSALELQSSVHELLEGCLPGSQPIPEPVSSAALPPPGVEPDLIKVFLEEAQEQLTSIARDIPHWQARANDDETLRRLRRSFHTLKGSGRLVGASTLGEFAWAFEEMLNRVIDGTLLPSFAVFGVLEQAPEALTQLIRHLKDGFAPTADIAGLTDQVHALHSALIAEPAAEEELRSVPIPEHAPAVTVLPVAEPVITAEPLDARANARTVGFAPDVPALLDIAALEPSTIEVLEPVATEDSLDAQPNTAANGGELQETLATPGAFEHDAPASVSSLEADSELVQIFFQEATDLLDTNELTVQHWIQDPGNIHWREELQRALHTLKGSARMAGVSAMGDLSHSLESLLVASVEGRVPVSPSLFELMQSGNDALVHMLESVRNRQAVARASDLMERVDALISQGDTILPADEPQPPTPVDMLVGSSERSEGGLARDESDQSLASHRPGSEVHSDQPAASPAAEKTQAEQVRVRAGLLDSLVNFAAEISIYHARLKQQVHTFHSAIEEFAQTTVRIQEQLRRLSIETETQMLFRASPPASLWGDGDASRRSRLTSGEDLGARVATIGQDYAVFDPLELDRYTLLQQLSRSMLESVSDLENIRGLLRNVTRDSEMLLIQQGRVHTELQEGLMRTRMLPFAVLVPRLRRVVRQVSAELGKPVNLRVEGEDNEIDRTVMDKIAAPLEHMLRNAVGHGLEAVQRRQSQGKPATGLITIRLCKEGTEVVLQMSDDGAGIDLAAVRHRAVERGLMAEDTVLSDRELMHFILEPGFSTATKVSQVSGRGVGMDVVDNVVKQLGGTLSIASKQGAGTIFTIRLPLMLSITQALVVTLGEEIYAVPLAHIQAVLQVRQAELQRYYPAPVPTVDYAGDTYQLLPLGALIDSPSGEFRTPEEKVPLLLLAAGDLRVALQVDTLAGRREIVVKSMGSQLSSVKGLLGATILGDGRVALILDTVTLARKAVGQMKIAARQAAVPVVKAPEKAITVLVVDDSITIRKITARLLGRHHMRVMTAKDGVDALEQLQNYVPDVAVLDIEMPRMDGYELARHIRHTPGFKHIPIIMITSRIGEKHREHARQIGVNRYLGKPYQETELLDSIYELLPERF